MRDSVNVYAPPTTDHGVGSEPNPDDYEVASKAQRLANSVVDGFGVMLLSSFVLILFLEYIPSVVHAGLRIYSGPEVQILWFGTAFAYYLFFEGFFQRTPGKWITRTLIVTDDYEKPGFVHVFKRTLGRVLPFEALTFLGRARGFHDHWSKTRVVRLP